ncbi:MAG: ABC transporter ATP-binding protein [Methanomicrobiales archaeon]|nr:ABC transporter ATP-binding protein [Methanomicrobiales archaeon]
MAPIVEMKGVWVRLGGRSVLEDVNFSLEQDDFYGVIGPNGGGKTTLIKVILGLIKPWKGEVTVQGENPEKNRHLLGYVPQYRTYDFTYPLTVREMVLSGRLGLVPGPFRKYRGEDHEKARAAMEMMGIGDLSDRPIGELSGGQQQRAIIARALVSQPIALLLDEPTTHVDPQMEEEFYEILRSLHKRMAILLVTHDMTAVSAYVDKIACLNRRLFTHGSKEISEDMLEAVYHCPISLIAHGVPHRVLRSHEEEP